jgi:integrase/recombinase XerD
MELHSDRLWTLAREPEGPLVGYIDAFSRRLDEQGFRGLGQQVRAAARFSCWLQSDHVAAEALTDEHVRRFLEDPAHRGSRRHATTVD